MLVDFLRDENLTTFGEVLEARADIDYVAHHGIVLAVVGTNQRRISHTGSNAHPNSKQVTAACAEHGGFYLGSIGGPAAILAKNCIKKVEVVAYPELGMEAIWMIEVENFPAFIVVDDKGNDFFTSL